MAKQTSKDVQCIDVKYYKEQKEKEKDNEKWKLHSNQKQIEIRVKNDGGPFFPNVGLWRNLPELLKEYLQQTNQKEFDYVKVNNIHINVNNNHMNLTNKHWIFPRKKSMEILSIIPKEINWRDVYSIQIEIITAIKV